MNIIIRVWPGLLTVAHRYHGKSFWTPRQKFVKAYGGSEILERKQSRTQSPQAPWSAVWSPGETLGKWVGEMEFFPQSRSQSLRSPWPAVEKRETLSFFDRWSRGTKTLGTRLFFPQKSGVPVVVRMLSFIETEVNVSREVGMLDESLDDKSEVLNGYLH